MRFLLPEDRRERLVFAPLRSERFESLRGDMPRELPDSVIVRAPDGRVQVESAAALFLLERLGGLWRLLAILARLIPLRMRNAIYRLVARNRKKVFGRSEEACPILPADLRARFKT